jgi:hypothetical protein
MTVVWALTWFIAGLASAFVLMAIAILWVACALAIGFGGAALFRAGIPRSRTGGAA